MNRSSLPTRSFMRMHFYVFTCTCRLTENGFTGRNVSGAFAIWETGFRSPPSRLPVWVQSLFKQNAGSLVSQRRLSKMSSSKIDFVNDITKSNKVAVFSKVFCSYCKMAKSALQAAGLKEDFLVELDEVDNGAAIQDALREIMYQSNRSFNIPPGAYPGHLMPFPAWEGGHLITNQRGWGSWSLTRYLVTSHADSKWVDKSWQRRRQTLMNSKEKIAYSWGIGWKPKVYTSFVLYLKVFKTDLCISLDMYKIY